MKRRTMVVLILFCPLLLIPFMRASAQDFSFTCDSLVQRGELGEENVFEALLSNNSDEPNIIRLELEDGNLPEAWNYFWCVGLMCLPPNTYTFIDTLAPSGTDTVYVHVFPISVEETGAITITAVQISDPESEQSLTFRVEFGQSVDDPHVGSGPEDYSVVRAYPNPFNPGVTINYSLEKDGFISVDIVNLTGRTVESLFRGRQLSGTHSLTWDGADERGVNMPGGVYIIRVGINGKSRPVKLVKLD